MGQIDEQLTEQFYRWEVRGRGIELYDVSVSPEPRFRPFDGHYILRSSQTDEGRRGGFGNKFLSFFRKETPEEETIEIEDLEKEPEPSYLERSDIVEVEVSLSEEEKSLPSAMSSFLLATSACRKPLSFEILALHKNIIIQFATAPEDAAIVSHQLSAHFPNIVCVEKRDTLLDAWSESHPHVAMVDFGLESEFMVPLAIPKQDIFVGLIESVAILCPGELALYQVIFEPCRHPWGASTLRAVSDGEGGSFFINRPGLLHHAKEKLSYPLYAATVRLAVSAEESNRAWDILSNMSALLQAFSRPESNQLRPLSSDDYPPEARELDVLNRQSHRSGMLLNSEELVGFVHLPSPAVKTKKLVREAIHTKAIPSALIASEGILLGYNFHHGKKTEVRLSPTQRVRHLHILGASGTGKSTLLFNLIRQDIENGEGVALLDPHGDLIDQVLDVIPEERINDVALLDPSDEEFPVGFNILSAHSELEKTLLGSDLVSVFERLSTSWGDQMSSVLRNGILAFLESSEGGTLSDLRRFLLDPGYRNHFLTTVSDPEVVYYWQKGFPHLSGNKSIGSLLTRLESFLSPKPIRYMVSQKVNRIDFAMLMDTGKILLAKLPQGLIGRENAYLLGSLLVSKFQQVAMSRQRQAARTRRDFFIYIDEFHHFITPSMAEILTGARKYRVGFILAHQELRQLQRDPEVASALLSNSLTRVAFRVGDADARALSEGFSSFEARDLQNLEVGEAICRVERSDFDFTLSVPFALPSLEDAESRTQIIENSRALFARPRAEVEAELFRKFKEEKTEEKTREPPLRTPDTPPTAKQDEQVFERESEPKPAPSRPEPEILRVPPPVIPHVPFEEEVKKDASSALPKTLGKGGPKHTYLQRLIKQWAQGMGYKAIIEDQIAGGEVDVSLTKPNRKIACEIALTGGAKHETGNIKKCLASSFDFVALVVPEEKRIAGFKKALQSILSEVEFSKLRIVTPEDLFSFIEELDAKDVTRSETVKGYKVKVTHKVVDSQTKAERQAMLSKIVADSLKRKKKE